VCYVCVEDLRKWSQGKKKAFGFGAPVIWREPKNHSDGYYFCCCDINDDNSKNKKVILYTNLPSSLRPVVNDRQVPVPQPTEILEDAREQENFAQKSCRSEENTAASPSY
jgi:hypothetical protein